MLVYDFEWCSSLFDWATPEWRSESNNDKKPVDPVRGRGVLAISNSFSRVAKWKVIYREYRG
jgi:hypothetical protein